MTQRDLAKDKEMCEAATVGPWRQSHNTVTGNENYRDIEAKHGYFFEGKKRTGFKLTGYVSPADARFIAEARQALPYYIANYEDAIHLLEFDKNALEKQDALIERLRGRIKELEALLHPNNRPDVVKRTAHDRMLEKVFQEMEGLNDG